MWLIKLIRMLLNRSANRAHSMLEEVRKAIDTSTGPRARRVADLENAARRTGKSRDIDKAARARRQVKSMLEVERKTRLIDLYERNEKRRDEAVRKADASIKKLGELKVKSPAFDRWLERH